MKPKAGFTRLLAAADPVYFTPQTHCRNCSAFWYRRGRARYGSSVRKQPGLPGIKCGYLWLISLTHDRL